MIKLNFDKIISNYNKLLTSTSRGFDNEYEFLESWVPRDDINDSISDLISSAKDYELKNLSVYFNKNDLDKINLNRLSKNRSVNLSLLGNILNININ